MDSTANILQFCRLCLVKDGVNIPIFDEQGDIRQIYLKISSCLPVKVAREDHLPKKICDGCSNKLDICYDFWRTSAESEKQLLAWLGATGKDAAQVNVKEEDNFDEPLASDISKNDDDENKCYMFEQKVEEGPPVEINDEPPPSKRPRRTAAVKAAIAMDQNSDDDGDSGEPITKMEDDSDETDGDDREPAFVDVPSTSADDQPGPSGVSKDGSDAPKCEFTSPFVEALKKAIFNKDEKVFTCKLCNESFKQKIRHDYHCVRVHGIGFPCSLCNKTFTTQRSATRHEQTEHLNHFTYHCEHCYKGFWTEGTLNKHKEAVHDGKRFPCKTCKKTFKSESYLKLHLKLHEESFERKTYKCEECGKVYTAIQSFNLHKRKHAGNIASVCNVCGKSVTCLSVHMRLHTGEKPFSCEFCDKTFAGRQNLKMHRRVHTKEKPFKCPECGSCFTQASTLTVHLRYHRNEKPFECGICCKKYVTKTLLKRHKCGGPPNDLNPLKVT